MDFKVHSCCLCIGLRTGSLLIGYLGVIANVIFLWMVISGILTAFDKATTSDHLRFIKVVRSGMSILFAVLTIFLFNLISSIILIIGLHMHIRILVKVYLIYTFLFIVLGVIGFIPSIADGLTTIEIIQRLIVLAFYIYFLIVVRSYWLKMDKMDDDNDDEDPVFYVLLEYNQELLIEDGGCYQETR